MKHPIKYLLVYILPFSAWIAFVSEGILSFLPVIISFVVIPSLELLFQPDVKNLEEEVKKEIANKPIYDLLLYAIVPIQWMSLIFFLISISDTPLWSLEFFGRVASFGMLCGVLGINVAHELGHRKKKFEKFLAKALLLSAQYMQFFIEHNKGHHKNVATHEDAATARYGEILPEFWIRSIIGVYKGAWKISNKEASKKGFPLFSLKNEMFRYQLVELILLVSIAVLFIPKALLAYGLAVLWGWLLLETVEYIEHYGLERIRVNEFRYENTNPTHSWNSNHNVGRLFLFELSRHSDHHYLPHKKYQLLDHHEESPQMPTGYPGMMLLATIPPLWFKIMNPKVKALKNPSV